LLTRFSAEIRGVCGGRVFLEGVVVPTGAAATDPARVGPPPTDITRPGMRPFRQAPRRRYERDERCPGRHLPWL